MFAAIGWTAMNSPEAPGPSAGCGASSRVPPAAPGEPPGPICPRTPGPGPWLPALIVAGALLSFPAESEGQEPAAALRLQAPDAVSTDGFTNIAGVHELSDGRVVLIDPQERRIVLLDAGLGRGLDASRRGQGPGEFLLPTRLLEFTGDTTAVVDRGNGRILLMDGGSPLPSPGGWGAGPQCAGQAPLRPASIEAFDRQGNVYFTSTSAGAISLLRLGPGECPDRGRIVASIPGRGGQDMGGGIVLGGELPPPFGPEVAWAVGQDGRVAVVHPDPFRVTVIDPDGRRREGPTVEHVPVRLGEAHRELWRREQGRPALMTTMTSSGEVSAAFLPRPGREPSNWPATLPPFPAGAAWFAPDGTLWVERWVEVGAEATFDLFDGEGRRTGRVLLPPGRRLVALGHDRVYAVVRDAVELEYLERYLLR